MFIAAGCCAVAAPLRRRSSLAFLPTAARRRRRWFSSSPASALADRVRSLRPYRRAALLERSAELAALNSEVNRLGVATLVREFDVQDLAALCRALSAGGYRSPDLLQASVGAVGSAPSDAAASVALAACEAGLEQSLGAELVDRLCGAGAASATSPLGGAGAAELALAAAAAGRVDAAMLNALLERCSAQEMDLDIHLLGDLRLTALLAGPAVVNALDVRASDFLRTLCDDVPLDDPRGHPPAPEVFAEVLTDFESEVSEALSAAEVLHSKGVLVDGAFFPLSNQARQLIVCPEDAAAQATYVNEPSERSAWQRWKYRVAAAAGWKLYVVKVSDWKVAVGVDGRVALLRKLLAEPPLEVYVAPSAS